MASNRDAVVNCHNTMIEMFEVRERPDIAAELRKIGPTEIDEIFKTRTTFSFDVLDQLRVVYCMESKVKSPDVKKYIEDTNFANYIVILREKLSANNLKAIHEVAKPIQIFELKELQFNISKHTLVPKHRLIHAGDEEINAIFQKLGIKSRSQLPVILKTDPMGRFLNAKTGDVVEITRFSPTSAEHIFYRICV